MLSMRCRQDVYLEVFCGGDGITTTTLELAD